MTRALRLAGRAVMLGCALLWVSPVALAAGPGVGDRPLSAAELRAMYSGKSWSWGKGGAALFRADGGFWAWTTTSYAPGTWTASDSGKLCFSAIWTNAKYASPARTCFAHAMYNGRIFQRKVPKGDWYLFSHAVPRDGDAILSLVTDDLVTERYLALKQQLLSGIEAPVAE